MLWDVSLCISLRCTKQTNYTLEVWCAPLTDCHVISFFLVSVIGSGSGSDSLLSTGPSRKWRNKNDLIIEDRRCNLTSRSANLLSWLCSDFRAQRPSLRFCREAFVSELCLITYLWSVPLALSEEYTFSFVSEWYWNCWWHLWVCLSRHDVDST